MTKTQLPELTCALEGRSKLLRDKWRQIANDERALHRARLGFDPIG